MSAPVPSPDEWWSQYRHDYAARSWLDYRHLLAEAVQHGSELPLLDVGCGYGFLVECARRFGVDAIGIESSEAALAEGRARHPLANIRRWTAGEPLPFEAQSIGIAMLNQVIDHVTIDENRQLFAELRRVLRPEGTLIVHSPSRFNRFDADIGHVTFFSPSEFRAFVCDNGFRVVSQPYFPQPILGNGIGRHAIRVLTNIWKPERLAATIDLIARRT